MFYIIGSKDQRDQFTSDHRIPHFTHDEALPDMAQLYSKDDETVCLYADLEGGSFTVQVMNADGMGIESEEEFSTYEEALEAYEANEDVKEDTMQLDFQHTGSCTRQDYYNASGVRFDYMITSIYAPDGTERHFAEAYAKDNEDGTPAFEATAKTYGEAVAICQMWEDER